MIPEIYTKKINVNLRGKHFKRHPWILRTPFGEGSNLKIRYDNKWHTLEYDEEYHQFYILIK